MKKLVSFLTLASLIACVSPVTAQNRFVSEEAQNRKIVLEEFTGINCGFCPAGHKIANDLLEQYGPDMFVINVHAGGYATPTAGQLDLRTDFGTALESNSGLEGYPAGSLNRHVFTGKATAMNRGDWTKYAPQVLQMASYVNVAAKGTLNWETRELNVTVQLYYTGNPTTATNYLHIAVLQDNIIGTQSGSSANPDQVLAGGKYVHHHALRHLITGQWGDTVNNVAQGGFREKTYTYRIPENIRNIPMELLDLQFIAFVTETRNEIMNACHVDIENLEAPAHYLVLDKMVQDMENDMECESSVRVSFNVTPRVARTPVTSITFEFESGAGNQEFTYTPDSAMVANRTYTITSEPVKIAAIGTKESVSVRVTKVNDTAYEQATRAQTDVIKELGLVASENITIDIYQDRFGTDITWDLKQADNGTVLASGGPYVDLPGSGTRKQSTQATLAASCYVFTINDKQKDGINTNYGNGHIEIKDANGGTAISNDGKYKESWRCLIRKSGVANENRQGRGDLTIAPNPAKDHSVLHFELPVARKVRIRVIQGNGACVLDLGEMNLNAGVQTIILPLEKLAEGMYFVQIQGEKLNLTRKLAVIR